MKEVIKPIFEWITGNYVLFEDPICNYLTMAIIGFVAFCVAWKVVGGMFREGLISSSGAGSIFHWIIRLIVFSFLAIVVSIVMWIIKLVMSVPLWAWILLAIGIIIFIIKKY